MVASRSDNRDSGRPLFRAPAVLAFVAAALIVWLLPGRDTGAVYRLALLSREPSPEGFLASHLLHTNGWHLIVDLLIVLVVGGWLETRWGTPKFLAFYALIVLPTTTVCLIAGYAVPADGLWEGLDAASFGAGGLALACLFVASCHERSAGEFRSGVLRHFAPRHLLWTAMLLGATGIAVLDSQPPIEWGSGEEVYRARVFLLPQLSGVVFAVAFLRMEPFLQRRATRMRAVREESERERIGAIRARVDGLLDKISSDGYSSLSADERSFLRYASKHFKPE